MAQPEVGTRIRFAEEVAAVLLDSTAGTIYTIEGKDGDGEVYYIDDAGERSFAVAGGLGIGNGNAYDRYEVVG